MMRSYDPVVFKEGVRPYPKEFKYDVDEFDFEGWLKGNVMYTEDGSIGLCSLEYPGVYTVHWFFRRGGRKSTELAVDMLDDLFDNQGARLVRGLTPVENRAACIAARKIGMKSYGILPYPDEDCELLMMTKEEFKEYNHG